MKIEISFASHSDKHEINNLRKQEYAGAQGYSLDLNTLNWKISDDESFVMIAKQNGNIISTMRGEVIQDQSVLEKKLECSWDFTCPLEMPVLLLSRAATLRSYQSQGLNLILRYWFLKLAVLYKIPLVLGTFVEGSPRQKTLLAMGYKYFENKLGWQQSTYRSHRPVIVAALPLETALKQALPYCERYFQSLKQNPKFTVPFPELRFVRSL